MPRSTKGPHVAVLEYFRSAPIAVALLVLDLVKDAVRERQAVPATPSVQKVKPAQTAQTAVDAISAPAKPAGKKRGPKPKAKAAKPATAVAASTGKPKGKPGPKPGSHRKKAITEVQPPLDLAEPIGEVAQDPGFEEQLPEQAEEYIEPEAELQSQD